MHLAGVKAVNRKYETLGELSVSLDDLKKFRQLESKCPGHPEYRWTSGVETTTGPLGQGVATSVGIALAGKWLAERYNRPDFTLFDYAVYALAGDGDGVAASSPDSASRPPSARAPKPIPERARISRRVSKRSPGRGAWRGMVGLLVKSIDVREFVGH